MGPPLSLVIHTSVALVRVSASPVSGYARGPRRVNRDYEYFGRHGYDAARVVDIATLTGQEMAQ
jgi:hypothetical protein